MSIVVAGIGCRTDPTEGMSKKKAAEEFMSWWLWADPQDWVVFTDGSKYKQQLGYGFAIYRGGADSPVETECGGVDPCAVVFDAEALGALRGLQRTSQRHFLTSHQLVESHQGVISLKWSPGHMNIPGNEVADDMAKEGLDAPQDPGSTPTLAGFKMSLKKELRSIRNDMWGNASGGALFTVQELETRVQR